MAATNQTNTKPMRAHRSAGACNWCGAVKWIPAHRTDVKTPPVQWSCDHHS